MAGLILSIGNTVQKMHINMHKTFEENISIEASIQQKKLNYCISKFKRKNQDDNNFLIDKDICLLG